MLCRCGSTFEVRDGVCHDCRTWQALVGKPAVVFTNEQGSRICFVEEAGADYKRVVYEADSSGPRRFKLLRLNLVGMVSPLWCNKFLPNCLWVELLWKQPTDEEAVKMNAGAK